MNESQIKSIISIVVSAVGGIAAVLGYVKGVDWVAVSGSLSSLGAVIYGWFSHTTPALVAQVAKSDEVHTIVVTPLMSMAAPSPKVVTKQ